MTSLLELRKVRSSYGYRQVLTGVDLRLQAGEIVCLLGPNGAGKSTLLNTIGARNHPEGGEILFRGRPAQGAQVRSFLAELACLHHEVGLLLDLSALSNLETFHGQRFRTRAERGVLLRQLATVGLAERAAGRARSFSRGMKQRLALARTFGSGARLLLLDEPATGLDRAGHALLVGLLEAARRDGRSVLMTVHDDEPFREVADRFVFLHNGRVIGDIPRAKYTAAARAHILSLMYE